MLEDLQRAEEAHYMAHQVLETHQQYHEQPSSFAYASCRGCTLRLITDWRKLRQARVMHPAT